MARLAFVPAALAALAAAVLRAAGSLHNAFVPLRGRIQPALPTGVPPVNGAGNIASTELPVGRSALVAAAACGAAALVSSQALTRTCGQYRVVARRVELTGEYQEYEEYDDEYDEYRPTEAEEDEEDEEEEGPPFAAGLLGGQSAFTTYDYNFDPLEFTEKCPQYLAWFREAELKHGRVAMLAWVGLVVPDFVQIPGPEKCFTASVVEAHSACVGEDSKGPLLGVYLFCLVIEMTTSFPKFVQGLTLENAGDYHFGVNFLSVDPAKAQDMRLKELKNGRLAMLAFGGAITQAVLTGNGFPWLFG